MPDLTRYSRHLMKRLEEMTPEDWSEFERWKEQNPDVHYPFPWGGLLVWAIVIVGIAVAAVLFA